MITKIVELSNDIELKIRSLTIEDLAENNEVVDLFIEMMRIIEEGKNGEQMINEIISNVPSLCFNLMHMSIVNETDADNFMLPSHIKSFFNLEDQLVLLNQVISISVNDFNKLILQKETAAATSEKLTKLMSRLYKK